MHPWHMLLADRVYTTPGLAARGMTKGNPVAARATPLTADHVAVCVVLARMLKRGRSLALILPQLGVEDVVAIAHYLTTLRDVVVASQTLPGPYATPARLRDQPCLRVISSNPEVCRQLRVHSYQTTGSATDFINVISAKAAITHPAERYPPPFAELIDLTAQPPGVDPLSLLHLTSPLGAIPRYVLAPLGNKHALLELRKQQFAIWLHRAGDARILSEIEELKSLNPIPYDQSTIFSRHCMTLRSGIAVTVRQLATDRCSTATVQAWRIIKDLDSECTNSGRDLIRIARGLLRFIGALAVPLPIYERTAHADHRMGRYAARQVSRDYDTLATLPVPNGQAETLRQELLILLHQIIAMLNAPDALSAKAAALLHWLRTTLDEEGAIEIVCPTTVMAKALREWLAQQGWDATGADPQLCVRTRREAWQAGQQGNAAESLYTVLLEALDFYSGVWFGGVRCHVLLWCYHWETNALYRQLDFIAQDTQLSSFPTGDKAALLCGLKEACPDQRVAESVEPAWQVTRLHDPSVGRYPILPSPSPTPLALPELDWLLAQLEQPTEPTTTTTAPTAIDMTQQLRLILDDGGPPVLLER